MNGREKIEAAFSPEGTPEFGAVMCYESIYVRDHWSQLTQAPWWHRRTPEVDVWMAAWSETVAAMGQDWMELLPASDRQVRENLSIEVTPTGVFQVDRLHGTLRLLQPPQIGGWEQLHHRYHDCPLHLASTRAEIDALVELPGPFVAQAYRERGCADLAVRQLSAYGAQLYPIGHVLSPIWCCYDLWGYEGLMAMVAEDPDLVRYACQRFFSQSCYQVQQCQALGARGIWLEECLMDSISPAAYAALSLPFLQPLIEEIRGRGLHSIHYFCGNPWRHLNLLLAAGADALAFEEGKKGFQIDVAALAEIVAGKRLLLGNLDALELLPHASVHDLHAEIARQVAAGRRNGSRFVLSTGSPITPETSAQRVRQMFAWAHELGKS